MMYEPPGLEIILTRLVFIALGRTVYKKYADFLPLSGSEKVLDFGSGLGTVAYYAAKRLSSGHLTCVDISGKWLAECRKTMRKYDNVSFLQGDICTLPMNNESFDMVYCHFVLHDIPDNQLEKTIPALAKLLKPRGLFVFREPLGEAKKLSVIQNLIKQNGLSKRDSRVTDTPFVGNTLDSIYIKQ